MSAPSLRVEAYAIVVPTVTSHDGQRVFGAKIERVTQRRPREVPGDGLVVEVVLNVPARLLERVAARVVVDVPDPGPAEVEGAAEVQGGAP